MAVIGYSLSERVSRWQVLISNLREEPEALPHVAEELAQLEVLLPQVRALPGPLRALPCPGAGRSASSRRTVRAYSSICSPASGGAGVSSRWLVRSRAQVFQRSRASSSPGARRAAASSKCAIAWRRPS